MPLTGLIVFVAALFDPLLLRCANRGSGAIMAGAAVAVASR